MLFRIDNSVVFSTRTQTDNYNCYKMISVESNQVNHYIASLIREEVNCASDRSLLSYSKSLAVCLLKYNKYTDNNLHIYDNDCVDTILYFDHDYYLNCKKYNLNEIVETFYPNDRLTPTYSSSELMHIINFIIDVSNGEALDVYLKLFTNTRKKVMASTLKDREVVVHGPLNDYCISIYLSAVYTLYALHYKYRFLNDYNSYFRIIEGIMKLPNCYFTICEYDERSALIMVVNYIRNYWDFELAISKRMFDDFQNTFHLATYYDPILEFHSIVNDSFQYSYLNRYYNYNIVSDLIWETCRAYLKMLT